jgi:plastocyanin domain-containing protein
MITRVALALALVFAIGCKKDNQKAETKPAPPAATTPGTITDGVRTVAIEANTEGYVPARIAGKPGEKLKLRFTRTVEGECLSQLKAPDGKLVDLPMNKPVDIDVTVPADGEVRFACGMDMFSGVVVAEKS